MTYGGDFVLTLFTNDPELAGRADEAGVDRVGLDLERLGKAERQAGLDSWISDHQPDQLPLVGGRLSRAKLFVRTNPLHDGIRGEVDGYLEDGAQVLMLPMFTTAVEARAFIDAVDGRAEVSLLVETPAAAAGIEEIVRLPGIDEIHIGLNDLHLGLGLSNPFEIVPTDRFAALTQVVRDAGIPLGFGGVARLGDERLPISADLVYAQYPRLGADRALVSRAFLTPAEQTIDLVHEVQRTRDRLDHWHDVDVPELSAAREALWNQVQGRLAGRAPRG